MYFAINSIELVLLIWTFSVPGRSDIRVRVLSWPSWMTVSNTTTQILSRTMYVIDSLVFIFMPSHYKKKITACFLKIALEQWFLQRVSIDSTLSNGNLFLRNDQQMITIVDDDYVVQIEPKFNEYVNTKDRISTSSFIKGRPRTSSRVGLVHHGG